MRTRRFEYYVAPPPRKQTSRERQPGRLGPDPIPPRRPARGRSGTAATRPAPEPTEDQRPPETIAARAEKEPGPAPREGAPTPAHGRADLHHQPRRPTAHLQREIKARARHRARQRRRLV